MRFHIHCVGVCAGLLVAFSTAHCRAVELPASLEPQHSETQGWTEQDRQQWYHTSAGTQLIPYDWFVALLDETLINRFAQTGILADPTHEDKLPIGLAKTEGPNVSSPQIGMTCAFCHTTQFTYHGNQIRIDGGPSLQYNYQFLQTLVTSLGRALSLDKFPDAFKNFAVEVCRRNQPGPTLDAFPEEFRAFAARVLQRRGQEPSKDNVTTLACEVAGRTQALVQGGGKDASPALWGPGRFDALGRGGNTLYGLLNPDNLRPANAPVSTPPLWGVWEYDWVQWAGSIQHPLARNVAQVIGVGAGLFTWAQSSSPAPSDEHEKYRSSVNFDALKVLEQLAHRLEPPRWPSAFPPIDRKLAKRGKNLYHGDNGRPGLCAHCHVAKPIQQKKPTDPSLQVTMIPEKEIGTDPLYLENSARRMVDTGPLGGEWLSAGHASQMVTTALMAQHVSPDDQEYGTRTNEWRNRRQYIARPHLAVWATAPYLHNGSVPSLYELLSPVGERRTCFYLSPNMEFDPQQVGFIVSDCAKLPSDRNLPAGFEFKTQLPGNSNQGHEFTNSKNCGSATKESGILGCELPKDDRWAIIEYLKTCDLDRLVMPKAEDCPDLKEP